MARTLFFLFLFFPSLCFAIESPGPLEMQDALAYRARGDELQGQESWGRALFYYEQAEASFLDDASFFNDKGVLLEHLGRIKEAEECYLKAIELDFKCLPAYSNLGYMYKNQKKYDLSAQYFSNRVQYGDPRDPWILVAQQELEKLGYHLPALHQQRMQKECGILENELVFQKALPKIDESRKAYVSAEIEYQLGVNFFNVRDYVAATEAFQACLKSNPRHKSSQHYLARIKDLEARYPSLMKPVLPEIKNTDNATDKAMDKAVIIATGEYKKGLAQMRLGRYTEAAKAFELALAFTPDNIYIQAALAQARKGR